MLDTLCFSATFTIGVTTICQNNNVMLTAESSNDCYSYNENGVKKFIQFLRQLNIQVLIIKRILFDFCIKRTKLLFDFCIKRTKLLFIFCDECIELLSNFWQNI